MDEGPLPEARLRRVINIITFLFGFSTTFKMTKLYKSIPGLEVNMATWLLHATLLATKMIRFSMFLVTN